MTSEATRPLKFNTTRSIVCEPGAVRQLGEICAKLSPGKVFLVTDPGILGVGLHEAALDSLSSAGLACSVFQDVQADPPEDIVLNALDLARNQKTGTVVGLGGGSSMDVAKLIAALCYSSQALSDAYGIGNLTGDRLPLVQIPTTAGTGSEVTPISIITTGATTKAAVVAPQLLPDVALLDPELTVGLPPHVTAATGIDAMVHAIESFTSAIHKNPYSDMLATQALTLMSANIETAVHDGGDLAARTAMLFGSLLAGQAFANSPVAAVHALAYPLGGHFHIPHGLSNSLVLPHVLRFNYETAEDLYGTLSRIVMQGAGEGRASESLPDYFEALVDRLKMPSKLRELNVPEDSLPMLASEAMLQQRLLVNNPRKVNEQDALRIYEAAY
ncbi:MAG: iron-containing alcohol dehydrogenase [Gammaproteobacteria bacterium]|nr:iron-containing alcohol dehydrogenase [Gammaproteobacteria bacterium]